ncbi:MAG: RsmD family RNA methyltransferase [Holosporales bacterium]|jgi:16S rRNA (guanine966-N2)-methyltransferase|nr:RsmD family RNA methyltransferase [Holosporales bacterium]
MLRVIAGKYKGRRLSTAGIECAKPTSGRGRQTVFDILSNLTNIGGKETLAGACVVDCFAGTGALGIEAASRGAREVIFIEQSNSNCALIKANAKFLKEKYALLNSDLFLIPKDRIGRGSVDLMFLDPPYNKGSIGRCLECVLNNDWLRNQALLVLEAEVEFNIQLPQCLLEEKTRVISNSKFTVVRYVVGNLEKYCSSD